MVYGTYLTSNSSFVRAVPLPRVSPPPYCEFPRDLGDRVPCHNYICHRRLRAGTFAPRILPLQHVAVARTFLLIMQYRTLTIRQRATAIREPAPRCLFLLLQEKEGERERKGSRGNNTLPPIGRDDRLIANL